MQDVKDESVKCRRRRRRRPRRPVTDAYLMFELYSTRECDGRGKDLLEDIAEPAIRLKVGEVQGERHD